MLKTISEHRLLEGGEAVLVALSGGSDSVALLDGLAQMREDLELRLGAVYVNHGIRPEAAAHEEAFCRDLCERLKVPLMIVREDVPARAKDWGVGLEEAGRRVRYAVFARLAEGYINGPGIEGEGWEPGRGFDRVALGHHADDQAETVLFRVLRGTGLRGLAGIPVIRGRIIRPLLGVTRAEILVYLEDRGLGYCEDLSNEDAAFRRNYIRHELMPSIREQLNPSVDRALVDLADTVGDEEAYLEATAARAREACVRRTPGGKIELDLEKFRVYDRWIRRRVLRYCLAEVSGWRVEGPDMEEEPTASGGAPESHPKGGAPGKSVINGGSLDSHLKGGAPGSHRKGGALETHPKGGGPDKETVDRLDRACQRPAKAVSLPGGVQATPAGAAMVIGRSEAVRYRVELAVGDSVTPGCPALRMTAAVERYRGGPVAGERRADSVRVDYGKVTPPLIVRNIEPGDRFGPLGLDGTKKVGDFLTDRKVPAVYRDEIPVVCDQEGIIWLVGYEIADRVKVDDSTEEVLRIDCTTIG